MDHFFEISLRSMLAFAILMTLARILGKTTIAQMTYHDFVAAITLGALTANLAFNLQMNIWQMTTALLTFSGIAYILMILAMKNRTIRKWVAGKPTVLIQDGMILENNMRKLKVTLDMLNQELREKNIFNIEEVQYAILELNGKVSVLRKPDFLPVIHKDLNIKPEAKQSFPVELIMDGKLMDENLNSNNEITKEWFLSQVKTRGLKVEDVSYAVKTSNGHLFFDQYEDRIRNPIDQE